MERTETGTTCFFPRLRLSKTRSVAEATMQAADHTEIVD